MSDLISRQSATKLFENMVSDATSHGISPLRLSPDYVISGIEALPSAQQWIPIGEGTPEEREWIGTEAFGTTISDLVLITFDVRGDRFVRPMCLQNGELSRSDKRSMDAVFGDWKMTAWMPLPEPYKEK